MSFAELRTLAIRGAIGPSTKVRASACKAPWQPASTIPGLFGQSGDDDRPDRDEVHPMVWAAVGAAGLAVVAMILAMSGAFRSAAPTPSPVYPLPEWLGRVAMPSTPQAQPPATSTATATPAASISRNSVPQATPEVPEYSVQQVAAIASPSVVTVEIVCNDGKHFAGSGFMYDTTTIVTNYHVIEGAKSARITLQDGTVIESAGFAGLLPGKDLAAIHVQLPAGKIKPLSLAAALPSPGEKVVAIGSPMGLTGTVSDGIVSARSASNSRSATMMPMRRGSKQPHRCTATVAAHC